MLSMSRSDIEKLYKRAQGASARIKHVKEEMDEAVNRIVGTIEANASAFSFGMIEGRYDGVEVVGMPLPLLAGFGLQGLGFLGIGGEHLIELGKGAFCAHSHTMGAGIGREMKLKAEQGGGAPAAARGLGYGSPLSDQQLRDLANGRAHG